MSERVPLGSTYRMQLSGVGFERARLQVGYLANLGIETLYVSPVFAAVPGSSHGYDVIDPCRLDPSLGTDAQFEGLLGELDRHQMRLLIDIVPNHMATDPTNAWWWDVLRRGENSHDASTFDIDWSQHAGRVMVAKLRAPLSELSDTVTYVGRGARRTMEIGGQRFPLAPGTSTRRGLQGVLERQHYVPAYWRLGDREGNCRRFFDIDGLIGVRVEDPRVFERTHEFLLALGRDERIAGWRVDHVDGLTDPATYLVRLASASAATRKTPATVLVEKILADDEDVPRAWEIDGTTGYEFSNLVGGLFVNGDGVRFLAHVGRDMTGASSSFDELAEEGKREVLATSFASALHRLVRLSMATLDERCPGHDLASADLASALVEVTVRLDVYRTYFSAESTNRSDEVRLARALGEARSHLRGEPARALERIGEALATPRGVGWELVERWQQLTGAVMAKGVEDTATYRYAGLLSHAEVGCDPERASVEPEDFHQLIRRRQPHPSTLNTTSTHDSKRSEDARARLFTLSEVHEEWARLVARWHRRYGEVASNDIGPDAHDELVAYQSLVCLWPLDGDTLSPALRRRVQDYVVKAAREAKRHTRWTDPDARYERSLRGFIARLSRDDRFTRELGRFMARVGPAAATNSLAMTVLKCVASGVPDFYQGSELWDFALTDPDNRRPVDYELRRAVLARLTSVIDAPDGRVALAKSLVANWRNGEVKLYVSHVLLALRQTQPELFVRGSYEVLDVRGPLAKHVVAIARCHGPQCVIAVVPRQTLGLTGPGRFPLGAPVWGEETWVRAPHGAPATFTNIFTGAIAATSRGRLKVGECLSKFPISVLVG